MGSPRKSAILSAVIILIASLLLWWRASQWYQAELLKEQRDRVAVEASLVGNALSLALNRPFARLRGLTAFVRSEATHPDFATKFETFSAELLLDSLGVGSIAVAPGGVVQYVYPLVGNEMMLGYEPLVDASPDVQAELQRVIESGDLILNTPQELPQNGRGLVAWQAIHLDDGTYWGLINMTLDLEPLLAVAGLSRQQCRLDCALRDSQGRIFWGQVDLFERNPVVYHIELPEDAWDLAVMPREGWLATIRQPVLIFQTAGLLAVLLITMLAYLIINRQVRLSRLVQAALEDVQRGLEQRKQTEAALAEREEQYHSVFESTSEGLVICNLETLTIVDANPAYCQMQQARREQLVGTTFTDIADQADYRHHLEVIRREGRYRWEGTEQGNDGTLIYIDYLGTIIGYQGKPHLLIAMRDVTTQVEAQQILEKRVKERTRELETLLKASHNLTATLELKPLLRLIFEQVREVVDYSGAAIFILVDETQLNLLLYTGPVPQDELRYLWPLEQGQANAQVIWDRTPVIIPDVRANTALARGYQKSADPKQGDVCSWLGVPLLFQGKAMGMLAFEHGQTNYYTPHHAELALAFASQAAIAVENARLYEQAQALASLEERRHLARELHDSVSQALYGIALGARTARMLLDRNPARLADPLDYILTQAEAALTEMRALIFELRPEVLEAEGLVAALTKQTEALQARHGLTITTKFCEEPEAPLAIKEALYRIAQEATHNIVKHAQASQIDLALTWAEDLMLKIKDNGRGFDPQESFPGHLGLQSMRERAEALGGSFKIESKPGQGTCIWVRVSLPPAPG